ncbi:Unknown protein [Striga hermonthica]|uniref:Transposase n=1 Tax=Striga hermonthica TaxID=68872 RepID=A0A9N7RFU2_STRHE|nr:Unknown protein [Striga hermonthica]
MLEIALVFQKAFDKLEDLDEKFLKEFGDQLPCENDWNYVAHFTKFLKRFYDVTCKLSGTLYATSNMYFPEIIRTLKEIENFEKSSDMCLMEMGKQMRKKFDKYWGSINKINLMLFIAVVLDPRYKMKYLRVKYAFHYSEREADELVDKVTLSVKSLINDYSTLNEKCDGVNDKGESKRVEENTHIDDDVDDFFLEEENQQKAATKDEFDRYLEEFSEKYRPDFDILVWWKVNSVRYPNLSCVARDVSGIQSSTVASESAFSTGGRTLDRFRSSLTPTTAEVLICCQDWLRNAKSPKEVEEVIEDLENLETDAMQDSDIKGSLLSRTSLDI